MVLLLVENVMGREKRIYMKDRKKEKQNTNNTGILVQPHTGPPIQFKSSTLYTKYEWILYVNKIL